MLQLDFRLKNNYENNSVKGGLLKLCALKTLRLCGKKSNQMITKKYLDELTYEIIGSSIEVQKIMGRGLLESIYLNCLRIELTNRNIKFCSEMNIPILYKEKDLDIHLRCDLFVENCIVVELKAVTDFSNIYEAQLLTYMKLLKAPKGILINFNSSNIFYEGQKTFVNEFFNNLE